MITRQKPIPKMRKKARRGRVLNPGFLMFVRECACLVCHQGKVVYAAGGWCSSHGVFCVQDTPTEAAHVGRRGLGQKCNDDETLPLCAWHHRTGQQSAHVMGSKFWNHHMLDRDKLIAEMQRRFTQETGQAL